MSANAGIHDLFEKATQGKPMIVDLRIYTCKPERLAEWVALYKEHAWPLQQKYLGRCLGWYTTAEGQLNRIVHLWAYDSQADREARRAAMAADPGWQAFVKKSQELGAFLAQENSILRPADFFAPPT
jgi:hypothetical protein